jgi:hypothetical protein
MAVVAKKKVVSFPKASPGYAASPSGRRGRAVGRHFKETQKSCLTYGLLGADAGNPKVVDV